MRSCSFSCLALGTLVSHRYRGHAQCLSNVMNIVNGQMGFYDPLSGGTAEPLAKRLIAEKQAHGFFNRARITRRYQDARFHILDIIFSAIDSGCNDRLA